MMPPLDDEERILCAAVWVDTGEAEPPRRSRNYPKTGLLFTGWRHGDCFTTLNAWAYLIPEAERPSKPELYGNQGFLTSKGRYVDREEGYRIALAAGQTRAKDGEDPELYSEDVY